MTGTVQKTIYFVVSALVLAILVNIVALTQRAHGFGLFNNYGPRPKAWCGWQARQWVGSDPGLAYNRAQEWKKWGRYSPRPTAGAIVIWSRGNGRGHVGIITGGNDRDGWVVKSGNDQGAVRERVRSVRGASFRVGGSTSHQIASKQDHGP